MCRALSLAGLGLGLSLLCLAGLYLASAPNAAAAGPSNFEGAGPPATVTLEAGMELGKVGENVWVDATVVDASGRPVSDGTAVEWLAGPAAVLPFSTTTTAGRSGVSWTTPVAGSSRITATVGGASAVLDLHWQPGAPSVVRLDAPVRAGLSTRIPLTATVRDRFANAVRDGVRVTFVGNGGQAKPVVAETENGRALSTWLAGPNPGLFTLRVDVPEAEPPGVADEAEIELLPADLHLSSSVLSQRGFTPAEQVHPGEALTWTLRLRNEGWAVAEAPFITVELPSVFAAPSVRASESITPRSGAEGGWRLPDLAPGEAITLELSTATLRDGEWTGSDLFFLRAEAGSQSLEASPGDLVRTDQVRIYATDLYAGLRLDTARSSLRPGGSLVYELLFGNLQPQTRVFGLRITDTLPVGTHFDHWESEPGLAITETRRFTVSDDQLVWRIEGEAPGSGALSLWLTIDEAAPPQSVMRNSVEIGSPVLDVRADNNVGQDDGAWIPGVDLQVELSGPERMRRGEAGRYVLRVRNDALRDDATGIVLEAVLAPGARLEALEGPGESAGEGRVRWRLERMGPGAAREVAFEARLPEDAVPGERFNFVATVVGDRPESDPTNDRALWTTEVAAGPPASVRITAGRRSLDACAGERTTLSAVVEDAEGFPVADGSELRWSTTAGQLSAPGIARGQALTTFTAAGVTTVSFTAARPLGEATVAGVAASATAGLTLALTAGPPVAISLSADPKIVPPGGQSTIMAQVLDACALPVVDGTSVRLLAERGSFDDEDSAEVERRTRAGKVSAALGVGSRSGPLRVTARGGSDSTVAEVQLDVRAPATPPPPPRWTIHLPFMRGGVRPARAAGR